MKVKALARSTEATVRQNSRDVRVQHRNLRPELHPHVRAREYTRALTSVKLQRIFAKPFVGSLEPGHSDGITAGATSRTSLSMYASASADGEVRLWDLTTRSNTRVYSGAHSKRVTGLVFSNDGNAFYSCGADGLVRCWNASSDEPTSTYKTVDSPFHSMDHHYHKSEFATASSSSIDIWSPHRTTPLYSYSSNQDTVTVVRYNPSQHNLIAHCSADRAVGLTDVRANAPLSKVVLHMKSNCLEWNPMEPMNFIVGNDDGNAYLWDMRHLSRARNVYKGHVMAIMDVSWSHTGQQFATAGYDKNIRIFDERGGKSNEIYHLQRMQRVFTIHYSRDDKYILSGSDDFNVRLWKARAWEKIGQSTSREESSLRYREALIARYKTMPEIRRISTARRVPKMTKSLTKLAHLQKESQRKKLDNLIHKSGGGEGGTARFKPEREKVVVRQID